MLFSSGRRIFPQIDNARRLRWFPAPHGRPYDINVVLVN